MPAKLDRRLKCRKVKTVIRPGKNNKLDRVTFPGALTISECVRSTPGAWGGQISRAYRLKTGGPPSHAKIPDFLKQKTHFAGRNRQSSADVHRLGKGSRLGHLREHALHQGGIAIYAARPQ